MKRLLFLFLIILCLASCKNDTKPPFETVERAKAMAMINHYLDSTVDHSLVAIIKFVKIDKTVLDKLMTKDVQSLKFITAAYLDTHKVTVLIQQKIMKGGTPTYIYYDISSGEMKETRSGTCPLPPDCTSSIED